VVELKTEPSDEIKLPPSEDWKSFLNYIKPRNLTILTLLLPAEFVNLDENEITLSYEESCEYHFDQMNKPENKHCLEDLYKGFSGKSLRLNLTRKTTGNAEKKLDPKKKILTDPSIMEALQRFNVRAEFVEEIKGENEDGINQ